MARRVKYLIDTENVGSSWTELLPFLGKNDEILLFYTTNSPGIPYRDLQMIMEHPLQLEMIPCNTGKNGLDFQLSSYLGYLLRSSAKARYVILSKDMGYDPLVQFWKERGAEITRESAQEVVKAVRAAAEQKTVQEEQQLPAQAELTGRKQPELAAQGEPTGKKQPELAEKVQPSVNKQPALPVWAESAANKLPEPAKAAETVNLAQAEAADKAPNAVAEQQAPAKKGRGRRRKAKPAPALEQRVEELVPETFRSPENIRDVVSIVRENYPSGLQEVNKALTSRFGQEGGNDLYRALKRSFRAICAAEQGSETT